MIMINCTCGFNVFMHCTGVILVEIIVILQLDIAYKLIILACLLAMEVMGNNQVTAWMIMYSVCN